MAVLRTGNRYHIGKDLYEVVIEDNADETCISQCDVQDCTHNKEFKDILKACGCETCIQLLGIGQCFKKVDHEEADNK